MPKYSKGHNSGKIWWNSFKTSNVDHVIYTSSPISLPSFKHLAQILFEISCWQDVVLIFLKGHNSRKEHSSDKKNNTGQLFFQEQFQNPSMHGSQDMAGIKKRDGQVIYNSPPFSIPIIKINLDILTLETLIRFTTNSSSSSGTVSILIFSSKSTEVILSASVTVPEWSTMSLLWSPLTSQYTTASPIDPPVLSI